MASGQIGIISDQFRRLFGGGSVSGMDEGELLRRFASHREPAALEALVNRYGPMVMGVCRRVLGNTHDADDAFQATFLVLARRAGAIRDPGRLGAWLHGVAHRVAVRARADGVRRKQRERPAAEEVAMATSAVDSSYDRTELRSTLDEEIRRLPEKFRAPVILCYLDGLTHDEAALRLRCPVGTVRSRLSTGRARLRERLTRRGLALPAGTFAAVLTSEAASAAVPSVLVDSTVQAAITFAASGAGAAAGCISAGAVSLAEGVTTTMTLTKLKIAGGLALLGLLSLGIAGAAAQRFGPAGGAGAVATATAPDDDSVEDLVAKLRKQAETAARDRQELQRALSEAQAEVGRLQAQLERMSGAADSQPAGSGATSATRKGAARPGARGRGTAKGGAGGGLPPGMAGGGYGGMSGFGQIGGYGGGVGVTGGVGGSAPSAGAAAGPGPQAPGGPPSAGGGVGSMGPMMGGMMGSGMMPGGPGGGTKGAMGSAMMGGYGPMMGMGQMMGGGSGGTSLATVQTDELIVVHKPQTDKVAAYSTQTGEWSSYQIPKGADASPIAANDLVALQEKGDEIREVATYVAKVGEWYPHALKEPTNGAVVPIVNAGLAIYPVGRHIYAFSAVSRTWDVLELDKGAAPTPSVWSNRATVEYNDHLYVFSVKTGKWTDFDTQSGKVVSPNAK